MRHPAAIALAAVLLAGSASASDTRPADAVVAVRFLVSEQFPERLVQPLVEPAQRALTRLNGVIEMNSVASPGCVMIELRFEGGATEKDVATVSRRIEELAIDDEIQVKSRTVALATAAGNGRP
ncbi:hypothetical protein E7V67_017075 [[Empedobacter] haloabium]|uniref:Uncharacterized protein n=1 Tax=[Empedobacter] haloabium TaxID=592317 RepID=A0ABZ1UFD4_9BURK